MTAPDETHGLGLPRPPNRISPLGPPSGGLAVATPARAGRFLIEGEAVTATGSQRGALETVRIGRSIVASDVHAMEGAAANAVVLPGLVRREWIGPAGTELETIVAAPTLPLLALQIGARASGPRTVAMDLHVGDGWTRRTDRSAVALRDPAGWLVAVGASPDTATVELVEAGPTGVRALVRASDDDVLTVLVSAGPEGRVRSAFAAAAHLPAHARMAGEGGLDDGLRLVTGVAEIDEGVLWARSRLRGALARAEREDASIVASAPLWAGLAALAVGDWAGSERALGLAAAAVQRSGVDAGSAAELEVLAEQAVLAVGAGSPLSRLGRVLAAKLVAARELAGRASTGRVARTRLPVVGAPAHEEEGRARRLRALLTGESLSEQVRADEVETTGFRLGAHFRSDPDAAWAGWRQAIAEGLHDGPEGIGTWDPIDGSAAPIAPETAALLLAVAHGLLGVRPDAPVGRMRLAPRLPGHLTRLRAEGLSLGEARLSLAYDRDGAAHRFTIEPAVALVPPNLVFEPAVAGSVREVRIDGAPAELDLRREGALTIVPVQLQVDGPRTVEILGA